MQKSQPEPGMDGVRSEARGLASLGWDGILFLIISFLALFARFRTHELLLGWYQDDFFYYLKVAENIASTGVSTFNGLNLANGYHPLWMALLVCLSWIFHGTLFFVALQLVSFASATFTYLLMRRVLRFYVPENSARSGAFVLGLEALMLIRYGMEVTLTVPLAALLIFILLKDGLPHHFAHAAKLGLVTSLLILSRLDAGLLVILLCVAVLLPPLRMGRSIPALLGFSCGVLPLLCLYFGLNLHFFHVFTPVSGLAKQMKGTLTFSAATWDSLRPTDRMRRIVLLPELLLIVAGAVVAFVRPDARRSGLADLLRTRILWSLMLFPLLHLLTLSLLSDWNVWPWYFYSLTLAAIAASALLGGALPRRGFVIGMSVYAGVLLVYVAVYAWKGPSSVTVFRSSQVARYMDAHPGIYMMGDQAGTTAYLAHQPIVQTEGLVMDRHFLQVMRARTPLRLVSAEYGARYYAVIGGAYDGDCLHLAEPSNAGPDSPRMMGTICHAPLAVFYREADHMPIRIFLAKWIR